MSCPKQPGDLTRFDLIPGLGWLDLPAYKGVGVQGLEANAEFRDPPSKTDRVLANKRALPIKSS